ncbi:MAG: hypothetical protein LBR83_09000, partial [Clostridiales bacterium]|nr:hypothetical protein [Clostridiales bacterium]
SRSFEAYNIEGSNYFKLRDLAYVLNGTAKQFNVGYDGATQAITIATGQPYVPAGGEMTMGDGGAKTAVLTASRIYLDGVELSPTVYNIGGNNFFKLVDVMEALNIGVTYNETTRAIGIDTGYGYGGVVTVSDEQPAVLPPPVNYADTPTPTPIPIPPVEMPTPPQNSGDAAAPYDLKWIDGANGIISFCKPYSYETSAANDYGYYIRMYRNGQLMPGDKLSVPLYSYDPQEEDISILFERSGPGEYVFEVIILEGVNGPIISEGAKSEPYTVSGEAPPLAQAPESTASPANTATGTAEFIIQTANEEQVGLIGIHLIFKGDAPDVDLSRLTDIKMTKDGAEHSFNFSTYITKETIPQYKGDNSPHSMFTIYFTEPLDALGIYALEFNYNGEFYKTGAVEVNG